jgi:hypothetical protein
LIVVAAVSLFLLVPASGPTSAGSLLGDQTWRDASDVSAAKKKKKPKKAPKKEEYMRAAPSGPPPGARK